VRADRYLRSVAKTTLSKNFGIALYRRHSRLIGAVMRFHKPAVAREREKERNTATLASRNLRRLSALDTLVFVNISVSSRFRWRAPTRTVSDIR